MTITPIDAANAINYLHALGALHVTDHQGEAWASYINWTIDLQPSDLAEAARRAARTWADQGRGYRLDAMHLTQAARQIHTERRETARRQHGTPHPPELRHDPALAIRWDRAYQQAIAHGHDHEQAIRAAWQQTGARPSMRQVTPQASRASVEHTKRTLATLQAHTTTPEAGPAAPPAA